MAETAIIPNPLMIIPFGVLLATIALAPLLAPHWWHKHFPKVSFGLGAITLIYYLFILEGARPKVWHTAHEYISFIALIGSLFVVSGGIHIRVKGEATPGYNALFLLIGAIIANVLGTTGASMLLIRPWIRMNKYRVTSHHIVFFILIVSNVGGCLTPIGDPPLFLGFLKGIPFWWVAEHCWPMWAVGVSALLATFYIVDTVNYRRAPEAVREKLAEPADHWKFDGLPNIFFLAMILGSVFISHPHFLREGIMIAAAIGSYYTTKKHVHESNDFNFFPVKEVAILFVGIFATMMPALDWLQVNASKMGTLTPSFFYWGSGILSSILDNAPTYLSFLSAIFGAVIDPNVVTQIQELVQSGAYKDLAAVTGPNAELVRGTLGALQQYHPEYLAAGSVTREQVEVAFLLGNAEYNNFIVAISIGAVFFGANTYIGNGPNFMVKSISHQNKVHTPTFLGYIFKYALPYMLPMLIIVWLIFFRK